MTQRTLPVSSSGQGQWIFNPLTWVQIPLPAPCLNFSTRLSGCRGLLTRVSDNAREIYPGESEEICSALSTSALHYPHHPDDARQFCCSRLGA